jgi:hypothetical protein
MSKNAFMALLLVSGALATPAHANYFSNPYTGVTLNIGSAPNPTPADVRVGHLPAITKDDTSAPSATVAAKPEEKNPPLAQNPPAAGSGATLVPAAAQSR